jgi:hypothetical protein
VAVERKLRKRAVCPAPAAGRGCSRGRRQSARTDHHHLLRNHLTQPSHIRRRLHRSRPTAVDHSPPTPGQTPPFTTSTSWLVVPTKKQSTRRVAAPQLTAGRAAAFALHECGRHRESDRRPSASLSARQLSRRVDGPSGWLGTIHAVDPQPATRHGCRFAPGYSFRRAGPFRFEDIGSIGSIQGRARSRLPYGAARPG